MKWRAIGDRALYFHSWGDEFVVYNSLSGDTHLVGSAAAEILLKLQQAPSDAATLAGSLSPMWEVDLGAVLEHQIAHLLTELNVLALIEPF